MSQIPLWRRSPHSFNKKVNPLSSSSSLIDKLTAFDISTYFDPPKPKPIPRQVLINLPLPTTAWKSSKKGQILIGKPTEAWEHPNNQVRTAKYSLVTFIPRNLAEQFRRIANVFFLLIVILQFIPQFSQVSPILGALPLFVVIAMTAIKDAYEDFRRHAADYQTNHQLVDVISHEIYKNPNITKSHSSRFNLTSFFNKKNPEPVEGPTHIQKRHWWSRRRKVPHSDTLHLPKSASSQDVEDNSAGFVPTAWQDLRAGDFIRLKNNEPVPADVVICSTSDPEEDVCFIETKNLDGETNLKSCHGLQALSHLRCANDCANSQDPRSRFIIENQAPDANMFSYSAAVVFPELNLRVPVNLESLLLRGTVIRNTDWVIGLIVLTGPDTKIMLNSSGAPSKRSKVERQMNPMVFINLATLALMCLFNGIATYLSESYYYDRDSYWTVGSNLPDDNPRINGLVGFANALVAYQNIVPISLYISIEFVRTLQAYFIWADDDLAINGRRTLARSWNLSDDLGQIQYIFSDKTGTLTQNLMRFRKCCIGGVVYGDMDPLESAGDDEKGVPHVNTIGIKSQDAKSHSIDSTREKTPSIKQPFSDRGIQKDLFDVNNNEHSQLLQQFFTCLGLCHTVLASEDEHGSIQYKAQSPDEAALVQAAADVGFIFRGRDKNVVRLQLPTGLGQLQTNDLENESIDENIQNSNVDGTGLAQFTEVNEYELLEVNEFTSLRKRMSVVVQRLVDGIPVPGELYLLVKGADNVIFERLASGQGTIRQQTDAQLEVFAAEGLRTLCLAYRKLDRAQLEAWSLKYTQARSDLGVNRDSLIVSVQDELENDLILLGATAIEDKLQEGVPEAIDDLKRAGIKVWVATGDKLETAVAIAKTCRLIESDMNLIVIRGGAYGERASAYDQIRKSLINFFDGEQLVNDLRQLPPHQERRQSIHSQSRPSIVNSMYGDIVSLVGEDNGRRTGGYGLVIDGSSLNHALTEDFTKEALLELSTRCAVVVCCRTSPKQKSEIVKLIKDGIQVQTLAIGDGANDVAMIQTADIGIGVSGEEGLQAVNASDYSIPQFKFISKLLFVHGHWSYVRNSRMICQFFFQEIIGIIPLFLFQFSCAYSTTALYEYTYILFYNIVWTILPVIGVGVFEQDVREKVLTQVPELYGIGREGKLFTNQRFMIYMIEGIYQGGIIYAFLLGTYNSTSSSSNGFDISMDEFSTVVIVAVILACNLLHALVQLHWNWWVLGGIVFGPIAILSYTAIYASISPDKIWTTVYGNNNFLWPSPYWWFGLLFSIVISLLPRYLWKYYQQTYYPTDLEIFRGIDKQDPGMEYRSNDRIRVKKAGASHEKVEGENDKDETPTDPVANDPTLRNLIRNNSLDFDYAELVRSRTSLIHDMATGQLASPERGFNFDQADGVGERAVGSRLRKYNSSVMSLASPLEARPDSTVNQFSKSENQLTSPEGSHRKAGQNLLNLGNLKWTFNSSSDNGGQPSSRINNKNNTQGNSSNISSSKKQIKRENPSLSNPIQQKERQAKRVTDFLMQPFPGYKEKQQGKPTQEETDSDSQAERKIMKQKTSIEQEKEIQELEENQEWQDSSTSPHLDQYRLDPRRRSTELGMIREEDALRNLHHRDVGEENGALMSHDEIEEQEESDTEDQGETRE